MEHRHNPIDRVCLRFKNPINTELALTRDRTAITGIAHFEGGEVRSVTTRWTLVAIRVNGRGCIANEILRLAKVPWTFLRHSKICEALNLLLDEPGAMS